VAASCRGPVKVLVCIKHALSVSSPSVILDLEYKPSHVLPTPQPDCRIVTAPFCDGQSTKGRACRGSLARPTFQEDSSAFQPRPRRLFPDTSLSLTHLHSHIHTASSALDRSQQYKKRSNSLQSPTCNNIIARLSSHHQSR
jgi:hypothetical protein